jgi:ATP synthase protein I
MSEPSEPNTGGDFDSRLARARDRERAPKERSATALPQSGVGQAYRIATELVAAVALGVIIGLAIDHWLDSQPWCLIVFTLLGFAAGIMNVFRLTGGYGYAAGYGRQSGTKSDDSAPDER